MSLADELLADLEDNIGDEAPIEDTDVNTINDIDDVEMEEDAIQSNSIRAVAKLQDSEELIECLAQIKFFKEKGIRDRVIGPVDQDPEYLLIVRANELTVEIDNEINVIHKWVKDLYSERFPELDSLVPFPIDYLRTVRELGNGIDKTKTSEVLSTILSPAAIMIVSVTASTTQGKPLPEDTLNRLNEACDMGIKLDDSKVEILNYVESRMTLFAPNLSAIIDAPTAAKMIGIAGGLIKFSQMPPCNIQLLGSNRKTLAGFASTTTAPHMGFIFHSELVQKQPHEIRRKLVRIIASKCALASRVDSFHESTDGSIGRQHRDEIEKKIDKMLEPPPVKAIKPLAAPIDPPSKRRGGRRARKMKERLGITDVRLQANRIQFGEIGEEAYQTDIGFTTGSLGKSQSGKVRNAAVDSKTKARISKTLQQKLHRANQSYGGSTTVRRQVAGTASSVAFTPLQGLEIVNPLAAEKKTEDSSLRYFGSVGGFASVTPK